MAWTDHAEVAPVDRRDLGKSEPFGNGHHARVHRAERQIRVPDDEIRRSTPIVTLEIDNLQVTVSE